MLSYRDASDDQLVRLAQAGDSLAFGRLVEKYEDAIYRLARRMTDTEEDAEDVLQEAFVRAFESISGFKCQSKFSTWLYRIAVNLALVTLRKKKVALVSIDEPIDADDGEIRRDICDMSGDPLTELTANEVRRMLDSAIANLSPSARAVFVLRHIEGLSTRDTGRALGLSSSAVKSKLHRAVLTLRQRLGDLVREEVVAACAS